MYHYMTKNRLQFWLFMVLLVLDCGGGSLFSLVMSALVDCAGKGTGELVKILLASVAYIIIYIAASILYHRLKNRILAEARYSLKKDLFMGIMNQTVADFDTGNSAGYMNELNNHVNLFETVYFGNIVCMLECLVGMAAAGTICILFQPVMLVLMIFLAFLTMGVTRLTGEPLERATRHFTEKMETYMAEIKDDFGGFRLVHSFGILPYILSKHDRENREMEEAKRRSENCRIQCAYTGQFVGLLSTVLVMAVAAYFSLKGMFSAGMVVAFGHLIGNIVSPITIIPSIAANFRASQPLQTSFRELMERKEEEGGEILSDFRKGIRIENLSFGYSEDREVLRDVSFHMKAGEHYALMGRSGSGKSTLLALLMGYYPDYRGKIIFDDVELRQLRRGCLGTIISVVSQETFLFQDTLRNNIALYNDNYTSEEIDAAIEQAGLKALVDALPEGLSTVINENGKNFSGGEKQRISLARALLRKSRILLLDEFTANLDEKTALEVEERVLELEDCLVIAVTHRGKAEILKKYDRVVMLGDIC